MPNWYFFHTKRKFAYSTNTTLNMKIRALNIVFSENVGLSSIGLIGVFNIMDIRKAFPKFSVKSFFRLLDMKRSSMSFKLVEIYIVVILPNFVYLLG